MSLSEDVVRLVVSYRIHSTWILLLATIVEKTRWVFPLNFK